jgi:hypothetical protein
VKRFVCVGQEEEKISGDEETILKRWKKRRREELFEEQGQLLEGRRDGEQILKRREKSEEGKS